MAAAPLAIAGLAMQGVGMGASLISGMGQASYYKSMAKAQEMQGYNQRLILQEQAEWRKLERESEHATRMLNADLASMDAETIRLQADLQRGQADIAEELWIQRAEGIERSTGWEMHRFRRFAEQFMGTQRTKFAKAGVELGSGTPFDVMADNRAELELEAHAILDAGSQAAKDARIRGALADIQGLAQGIQTESLAVRAMAQGAIEKMAARQVLSAADREYKAIRYQGQSAFESAQLIGAGYQARAAGALWGGAASAVGGIGQSLLMFAGGGGKFW